MKAKTNNNLISKMRFAALAVLCFAGVAVVNAGSDKDSTKSNVSASAYQAATEAAFDRLDVLSRAIEESVRFIAPSVDSDIEAYELQAAGDRLENLHLFVQQRIRYIAPEEVVNKHTEDKPEYASIWNF